MTYFIKNGNTYRTTNEKNLNIRKELEPNVYVLGLDMAGYYFEEHEVFSLPKKFYGNDIKKVDRVIKTFEDRKNSTGIILSGEKGSGKTLFVKVLANKFVENKLPVILINRDFSGDSFSKLIQSIDQPAMLLFDEYEKVYGDSVSQEQLLTLFDGVFNTKKLFAVTCNEQGRLSDYMINRPGRFYYTFKYAGLDESFIRDYLNDNLVNKSYIESFVRLAETFRAFNFDMLQALTEEMNRYNESPADSMKYLNIDVSYGSGQNPYDIEFMFVDGVEKDKRFFKKKANSGISISPLLKQFYIEIADLSGPCAEEDVLEMNQWEKKDYYIEDGKYYDYYSITIAPKNLIKFDKNVMVFKYTGNIRDGSDEDREIIFGIRKGETYHYDYRSAFDF